jgi:cytochrome P450
MDTTSSAPITGPDTTETTGATEAGKTTEGSEATAASETTEVTGITDEWCRHHFDHYSPQLAATFVDTLTRMRSLCPVAHSDQHGGFWVVTGYDDVVRVAHDWETFSSAHGLTVPVAPVAVRNIPVEVDPPIQRTYKRLINTYLSPAAVAPWEPATRALATRLIDDFVEDGNCEFMEAFARPFPSRAFFELGINAPPDDIDMVASMASRASTPNDPDAAACWAGLSNWVTEFLDMRRRRPSRDDVVDGVLHAEIDGRPITDEEVVGIIQLLILGGLETTAGTLGLMMVRFCEQPEIPALLRARPELIPAAVEELLRLDGSFVAIARTATRDADVDGQPIRAGDKVMIYWASADRDETEFPRPDAFDLERESNRHLAFGIGPHRCAGSNVARLNLRVALEELVPRLEDIGLEESADIRYHTTSTRAPLAVPIRFTPGPRVGTRAGASR